MYGGHKSNFGGHNKIRYNAINAYSKVYQEGLCCRVNAQNVGNFTDAYYNNTCVQSADNLPAYTFRYCDPSNPDNITNLGVLHDNTIYNPSGKMTLLCGGKTLTEEEFQQVRADCVFIQVAACWRSAACVHAESPVIAAPGSQPGLVPLQSGADRGTVVAKSPASSVIIGWAKTLLGF